MSDSSPAGCLHRLLAASQHRAAYCLLPAASTSGLLVVFNQLTKMPSSGCDRRSAAAGNRNVTDEKFQAVVLDGGLQQL